MKKILFTLLLLVVVFNLFAEQLSTRKAMLLSAILPGWGQAYAHSYTKSGFYLAAEVGTYLGWMRLRQETDWAVDAYKDYAESIAGVPEDRDKIYYQLIQDNFSSGEYNASVERYARNVYLIINNDVAGYENYMDTYQIPEEFSWSWDNDSNWNRYKDLRYTKQNYEVYENFAVAALIINRLVSAVDAAVTVKRINRNQSADKFGQLQVTPDFAKNGMKVSYEIKF